MYRESAEELFSFIESSPTSFHAIHSAVQILQAEGYEELLEGQTWEIREGGRYFVTRNHSSLLAFKISTRNFKGFQIVASHSDAPAFKLKESGVLDVEGKYTRLNVEGYGGGIWSTWLDRPLSLAGRVILKNNQHFSTKLVNLDKDLLTIPSLAIHLTRDKDNGTSVNIQKDMLPLFGEGGSQNHLKELVAEELHCQPSQIVSWDLFLYNRMKGYIWGDADSFISSPRLDDLQCAFSSLKSFIASNNTESIPLLAIFDNEEVGSGTKQGAFSTFLSDVLSRINGCLGYTQEELCTALSSSLMVSADNGHALHPNYPEKADPSNRPVLNGGVLIKNNANQKYTTDAVSQALFATICEKAGVPFQYYVNRSDIPGGSTLGNISNSKVSLNTVDIGVAQLGMHSAVESGGIKDTWYLIQALTAFYSSSLLCERDGEYTLL